MKYVRLMWYRRISMVDVVNSGSVFRRYTIFLNHIYGCSCSIPNENSWIALEEKETNKTRQCYTKFNIIFIYLFRLIRWACASFMSQNNRCISCAISQFTLYRPTGIGETLNFSAKETVSSYNHAVSFSSKLLRKARSTAAQALRRMSRL